MIDARRFLVTMQRNLAVIIGLAAAGQAISYGLAIVLARSLGIGGFEAYVVASAIFILAVALAPCGLDKFALRVIPSLLVRDDWSTARGFLTFGARRTLVVSVATLVVGSMILWSMSDGPNATRVAILVALLSLPAGALAHFGLEVLTAAGREVMATAILRVGVPALVLILVGLAMAASLLTSGATAVGAWGLAWVASVIVLVAAIRRTIPPQVWQARPSEAGREWTAEASLFWVHRVAMALIAQASVIALELLQPSAATVGAYAAAIASTSPALVLVTATNRVYARQLSVLLETRDFAGLDALRRSRLQWLVPAVLVFLLIAVVFAEEVVGLFGPDFVAEGTTPLRLLALTTGFTMLFALAPTYLKFTGQRGVTFWTLILAVAAQFVLLALLVPLWGATGAALSYALSMIGMYGSFTVFASLDLRRARKTA